MASNNNLDLPRTRAEAKVKGSERYFTGKPCVNGHTDWRNTRSGDCAECNRDRARRLVAEYPERKKESDRAYRERNLERSRERSKQWKLENPSYQKEWYEANPGYSNEWKRANPEKVAATTKRSYDKKKSSTKFKLESSVKAGVAKGIRKGTKSCRRTFELLGYYLEELMGHLDRKFSRGMTWENYGKGGWHVDHIVPLSAHNYETPDDIDFKKAWSLSNLQPLWEFDNISKHAKLDKPFQPSLALAA